MGDEFLSETYENSLSNIAENESDSEDTDIQPIRKRANSLCLLSSSSNEEEVEVEESDKDWSDFDLERCNEQFEKASELKIFPNNPQSIADVTSIFVGEDLIEKIVYETNRYHNANSLKYKKYEHGCQWVDVTVSGMKKVFGLILLLGLSVKLASTLLLHKVRVCGTIRSNQGVPNVLRNIKLRHGETRYKRRREIMIQVWDSKKKRNIQMISTIHNADMIDSNKIDRNTQLFFKKPHCIIDYNQYMNGVHLRHI
uniref:DDE_Tnp_1_7 domain-containing protein n=1 Tax=Glossina pallidipes TaxID=7398 RepID=A0A1B0AGU8_GLOPL